ncbi:MAG: hypothetical protein ACK42I_01900, partial [Thermomicrobium sp.]
RLASSGVTGVSLDGLAGVEDSVMVILRDVINPEQPWRHDPNKLADALLELARAAKRGELPLRRGRTLQPAREDYSTSFPVGIGQRE